MKIIDRVLTKNDCYTANRQIAVKGLMIHSVGCSQPSAIVFIKNWDTPKPNGSSVCVHGFIDGNTGDVYKTLPWNWRAWHCGSGNNGSGNNTHIGVEMCEPATIAYTGGASWTDKNPENTKAVVMRTYKAAVELFAFLCKEYKLEPLADGVIISHSEGYKRGIASNHGDVEHIWNKFGLTMAQFRKDIKAAMGGTTAAEPPKATPAPSTGYKVDDVVQFTGGGVYKSSDAPTPTHSRGKSRCKVTQVYNGKHPYHLISEDDGGVHGWVDTVDIGASSTPALKSVDEIAKEVINGKWGNGDERKQKLTAAGYNYSEIQARVNTLLK